LLEALVSFELILTFVKGVIVAIVLSSLTVSDRLAFVIVESGMIDFGLVVVICCKDVSGQSVSQLTVATVSNQFEFS